MTPYKIKLVSQPHAIALILCMLVLFFAEVLIFYPGGLKNTTLSIGITAVHLIAAIFLWQKFVTGRTIWTVDQHRITIRWTKKFAFSASEDYELEWNTIEKIWKGADPQYYNLKIRFTNGQTITFYHDELTTRDDFEDLKKTLYQTFAEIQKTKSTNK